ncbi:MAG: M48 family metallopeptidase [Candidatus Riflebacteria bacterium]|nr:M48 family metallopeptidase [Candidatus Riflebacteria bacterium]
MRPRSGARLGPGEAPGLALQTLQTFKGLDYICKKILEYGMERIMQIENIGNRVQVGPAQLPDLHNLMRTACTVLDLPPVPLYVEMNPVPNAYTYGVSQPFVIMTTGLLDLLTPDELLGALGHELGHVLCRHVLYRIVAENISTITTMIGQATLGIGKLLSQGLVLALLEWYRKSEYTADRAGLLTVQDPNIMVSTLMKLAGGASRWTQNMNQEAFLKQADQYDALDESTLNKAYKFLQQVNLSHPIPVLRAKEINTWGQSFEYRPCQPLCGYCKATVGDKDAFCPSCGSPVAGAEFGKKRGGSRPANCPSCLAAVPGGFEQCPVCGKAL